MPLAPFTLTLRLGGSQQLFGVRVNSSLFSQNNLQIVMFEKVCKKWIKLRIKIEEMKVDAQNHNTNTNNDYKN